MGATICARRSGKTDGGDLIPTGAVGRAVTLAAPTNLVEFNQRIEAVTRGQSWHHICAIYKAVLSTNAPPAGTFQEILDLRTFAQGQEGEVLDTIKLRLSRSLAEANWDCGF